MAEFGTSFLSSAVKQTNKQECYVMNFSAKPITFYEYYCDFSNLIVKPDIKCSKMPYFKFRGFPLQQSKQHMS